MGGAPADGGGRGGNTVVAAPPQSVAATARPRPLAASRLAAAPPESVATTMARPFTATPLAAAMAPESFSATPLAALALPPATARAAGARTPRGYRRCGGRFAVEALTVLVCCNTYVSLPRARNALPSRINQC